jgi:hypothetical protein
VLAELAVVEPDDQPYLGVETAGGERGADVDLVVVMDERQGRGVLDARLDQHALVEILGLEEVRVPSAVTADAGGRRRRGAGHGGRHPPDEAGGSAPAARRGGRQVRRA